ncbi:MAG: PilZ domain-containing protein [Kofleriaceae bacterium]
MTERRWSQRHEIQVPVNVSTNVRRDRVGVIRDVSSTGMLFHSLSKFAVGEQLTLNFHVGQGAATATVVRAACDANPENMFRFLTAVRFDKPVELGLATAAQSR